MAVESMLVCSPANTQALQRVKAYLGISRDLPVQILKLIRDACWYDCKCTKKLFRWIYIGIHASPKLDTWGQRRNFGLSSLVTSYFECNLDA